KRAGHYASRRHQATSARRRAQDDRQVRCPRLSPLARPSGVVFFFKQKTAYELVDVIDVSFTATQLEHVFQAVDQILAAEGHDRFGHVLVELAVDAESADAAETIAVLIEELFFEQRL